MAPVEDTYESQNEERLDDLHSKIRAIRGVTNDIHDDVERQNLMLDDTGNSFSSFGDTLAQTSRRAGQALGLTPGSLKTWRVAMYVVGGFFAFWILHRVFGVWNSWNTSTASAPTQNLL